MIVSHEVSKITLERRFIAILQGILGYGNFTLVNIKFHFI